MAAIIKSLITCLPDTPKETVPLLRSGAMKPATYNGVSGGNLPALLSSTFLVCKLWLQDNLER